MINEKQLAELNEMRCSVHNDTPKAEYKGEDINFKYCCEDFKQQIKDFVREKTLKNIQNIARKTLGLN